jgi:sugar phosphate isomerase/epimerase
MGFDGLAIETKRPVASPLDLSKADRSRIKTVAADQGIDLCAIESMSNFASRYMEERENNLAMMRFVLELANDLGVKLVKIFAAWPGIINDEEEVAMYAQYDRGNYFKPMYSPDLRLWHRAIDGIREVADQAADMGITLALQNHAPILRPGFEDVLAMTEEVDRKNVKICLDVPLFYDRQHEDYVREAVHKCRKHIVFTHFGAWNFKETKEGPEQEPAPGVGAPINYETFIDALQQIGYNGYLVSEYCLPIIKNHVIAGIEEVDKATVLSLKYMKQLVHHSASVNA